MTLPLLWRKTVTRGTRPQLRGQARPRRGPNPRSSWGRSCSKSLATIRARTKLPAAWWHPRLVSVGSPRGRTRARCPRTEPAGKGEPSSSHSSRVHLDPPRSSSKSQVVCGPWWSWTCLATGGGACPPWPWALHKRFAGGLSMRVARRSRGSRSVPCPYPTWARHSPGAPRPTMQVTSYSTPCRRAPSSCAALHEASSRVSSRPLHLPTTS